MSESRPCITYSSEGILSLNKVLEGRDEEFVKLFGQRTEDTLGDLPGYSVSEGEDGFSLTIDVPQVIAPIDDESFINPKIDVLLRNIQPFVGYAGLEDSTDYLFSLDYWYEHGAGGVIFPGMQRWLNAGGLTEEVAKECIEAMALPYGSEKQDAANEEFEYRTDGESAVGGIGGFTFGVISKREDFGIEFVDTSGEERKYRAGKAPWNWINLSTIGSCACWGPSGQERERVYVGRETSRLYEMHPHNVDMPIQSLSLVLGAGVLAREASEYKGQEDILENATWRD